MSDDDASRTRSELEREIRTLRKKLARTQRKTETLERFQDQNQQLLHTLMADLDAERAESERLLLNILPEPVAERLKRGAGVIADEVESASVMFIDVVGFTPLSQVLSAEETVAWLDDVYSAFDAIVQEHGVEKIRTIGDGYMVAAGVPDRRDDHAVAITRVALEVLEFVDGLPAVHGHRAAVRIGINSGPLVAGVIGTHKFQYDLWGDTVNTAARMESHGVPGRIQVSASTHGLIADDYVCEARGEIEVKGKGTMPTWFVTGERPA